LVDDQAKEDEGGRICGTHSVRIVEGESHKERENYEDADGRIVTKLITSRMSW
jgi:hypothetical protein